MLDSLNNVCTILIINHTLTGEKMFQVTIVNAGIENFQVTQYCVIADSCSEAGKVALEISGSKNHIKLVDIKKYLSH